MKFVAASMIILGLAFSLSASAGVILGGGGLGSSALRSTELLIKQTELSQFTLLPSSAKTSLKETMIADSLKFVPDDEIAELLDTTSVQLTDDSGRVVKTFAVSRVSDSVPALVFVEVPTSLDEQ